MTRLKHGLSHVDWAERNEAHQLDDVMVLPLM